MAYSLKLALWNANGLLQHSEELKIFLRTKNLDVILISETHFNSRSYLSVPNYSLYHTIHPDDKSCGGTAILVKKQHQTLRGK